MCPKLIYQHQNAQDSRIQGKAPQGVFPHYFEGQPYGEETYYTGAEAARQNWKKPDSSC